MTNEEFAKDMLGHIYSRIQSDRATSTKIRNWCITVWVGTLALVNSDKLHLSVNQRHSLPLIPIALFWLLDSLQHVFLHYRHDAARDLEEYLLGLKALSAAELRIRCLGNGISHLSFGKKLTMLFRTIFIETNTAFYVLLLTAAGVFAIFT